MPSMTRRRSTSRGRPLPFCGGISGLMFSHWASVVSVGYGFLLILKNIGICPGSATPHPSDSSFPRQKISKQTLTIGGQLSVLLALMGAVQQALDTPPAPPFQDAVERLFSAVGEVDV